MANNLRFQVVEEAFKKRALDVKAPSERPSEYFGKYVFNKEKMYRYLPKNVYDKMIDVMDNGARLDRSIADAVAAGTTGARRIVIPQWWYSPPIRGAWLQCLGSYEPRVHHR